MMQEVGALAISRDVTSLLSSCSAKLLKRIGVRILEAMPVKDASSLFSPEELAQLAEGLQLSDEAVVQNMLSACLRIFRSVAFHQPKEEQLREQIEKARSAENRSLFACSCLSGDVKHNCLGLSADVADVVIGLWESELGQTTIARLSEVTHTGLPRLRNVDWSIVRTTEGSNSLNRCSSPSTAPAPAAHSIALHLQTTQGDRELRMTRAEAIALYEKLNDMQRRIDMMLE
ncbi:hypothetical protein PRIPAC_94160 [Pristionchus pacificus]|uniref:COMM domain-containing protein n=1 Tax=Pristionchus pacificus TaxID=54126 RepID=A0A2A6CD98_PRIPA|nr:hypothetical protein PRIPAC_94160 [Pristionchus pacificus]|eukprot:PDM76097.1 hypothetical protein PRIPAC_39701 [Pristionchus pacificus]